MIGGEKISQTNSLPIQYRYFSLDCSDIASRENQQQQYRPLQCWRETAVHGAEAELTDLIFADIGPISILTRAALVSSSRPKKKPLLVLRKGRRHSFRPSIDWFRFQSFGPKFTLTFETEAATDAWSLRPPTVFAKSTSDSKLSQTLNGTDAPKSSQSEPSGTRTQCRRSNAQGS